MRHLCFVLWLDDALTLVAVFFIRSVKWRSVGRISINQAIQMRFVIVMPAAMNRLNRQRPVPQTPMPHMPIRESHVRPARMPPSQIKSKSRQRSNPQVSKVRINKSAIIILMRVFHPPQYHLIEYDPEAKLSDSTSAIPHWELAHSNRAQS